MKDCANSSLPWTWKFISLNASLSSWTIGTKKQYLDNEELCKLNSLVSTKSCASLIRTAVRKILQTCFFLPFSFLSKNNSANMGSEKDFRNLWRNFQKERWYNFKYINSEKDYVNLTQWDCRYLPPRWAIRIVHDVLLSDVAISNEAGLFFTAHFICIISKRLCYVLRLNSVFFVSDMSSGLFLTFMDIVSIFSLLQGESARCRQSSRNLLWRYAHIGEILSDRCVLTDARREIAKANQPNRFRRNTDGISKLNRYACVTFSTHVLITTWIHSSKHWRIKLSCHCNLVHLLD